jgi:two-component system, OmpR family, response regulator
MENAFEHTYPVLIVDDEKDICYLLSTILKQRYLQAHLAGSLAEADKVIENHKPSLVFLDNHLPDGFGLEYISTLKKKHPAGKIVMITAHDNPSERARAYREGVDFFISKPFTKDIIYQAIEQLKIA